MNAAADATAWRGRDGEVIACREKRRVLDENLAELDQVLRDMFEDAILMGVDEDMVRRLLAERVASLRSPHRR